MEFYTRLFLLGDTKMHQKPFFSLPLKFTMNTFPLSKLRISENKRFDLHFLMTNKKLSMLTYKISTHCILMVLNFVEFPMQNSNQKKVNKTFSKKNIIEILEEKQLLTLYITKDAIINHRNQYCFPPFSKKVVHCIHKIFDTEFHLILPSFSKINYFFISNKKCEGNKY